MRALFKSKRWWTEKPNESDFRSLAAMAVEKPVFVIGTMRSGTGFMGLQLNESQKLIGCPFELRRIWNNIGNVPMASDVCGSMCPHLTADDIKQVNIDELKQAFIAEVIKNRGTKILSEESSFLSKNPHLCNKIKLVGKLFPHARFVWTIRNLEEVVCSLKNLFERENMQKRGIQHIWPKKATERDFRCFSVNKKALTAPIKGEYIFPYGDIWHLAEYWLESNLSLVNYIENHGSSKIMMAAQAYLVEHPAELADRLSSFLGLDPADLQSMSGKIDRSAMRLWKESLTQSEIHRIESFKNHHEHHLKKISNMVKTYNQFI